MNTRRPDPSAGGSRPVAAYHRAVDAALAVALAAGAGALAGAALHRVLTGRGASTADAASSSGSADSPLLDLHIVDTLPLAFAVVGSGDEVLLSNSRARDAGIVRGLDVDPEPLRSLVREARRLGTAREADHQTAQSFWRARALPLDEGRVALVVEDRTESRRIEAVRRDFVANVGHELKTPVGALSLLAEATKDAADDPEAVRHFTQRMQRESSRLTRLVQDIIDLSRLQGTDPLAERTRVELGRVIAEAVDRCSELARSRGIDIAVGGPPDLVVEGDERQLVTAVSNLLQNAVTYSPEGTHVAVAAAAAADGWVEVSVTDQGIGIPASEHERIFERFYRVDPARSRDTGGTGLGLAIVKHVATGHGGSVQVWSREGSGSTFTFRLPPTPDQERKNR